MDGTVLRAWRRSRGWDAPETARRLRKAADGGAMPEPDSLKRMIWRWEREGLRTERYELLFAKALGVSPADLARGPTEQPTASHSPAPAGAERSNGRGHPLGAASPGNNRVTQKSSTNSMFGFSALDPDMQPILRNMTQASALPAIRALRDVQQGYLASDRLLGALSVSAAVRTHIPIGRPSLASAAKGRAVLGSLMESFADTLAVLESPV